ncbi:pyrroloquinoline quinone-dependent dehydrogenase [Polymorphobacter megasporae]|uniref:pyrroloquinoline quinone-dependent dehydrogenase n=1 Tax=Glacieibacterium megasporae TaxID=2835787 RepID=UPI001C1E06AB|nr:pyrroloquinoline quinone-dependent dehydrogenase [Polymorphobacter megasporae]UAJ10116.1 pyrroloquinoline quinone-dependent dehydrogenase [Polymorphobacter megasporae]
MRIICAAAVLMAATPLAAAPSNGEWPTYGHDKGGMRYSTLAAVTPANIDQLAPAWTYHMRPAVTAPAAPPVDTAQRAAEGVGRPRPRTRFTGSQTTPLVIAGTMYASTPYGRVVALDATTGAERWVREIPGPGQPSLRGVEYWPGDASTPARLVFGTRDGRLIALDAATGAFAKDFGNDGIVELKTPAILNGLSPSYYGMTSPPLVWRDLVVTGSATQEFPALGAAGDIRAWNVRTGALAWTFHTVPRRGEPGYATWAPGSAEQRSGNNNWGFMTADVARGIVYIPLGAPTFDRYGGDRHGDNLYGTSLVALDAATGKLLWYKQIVHHDIWDADLEAPPILFDVHRGGKTIAAVAITSKSGMLFIFDRVTGKPVYPVTERKVPPSDVPGEAASPTQPFSSLPAFARQTFDPATDTAQLTPELTAWCGKWIADNKMVAGSIYQPVRFNRRTISFPGLQGGGNWSGSSFDPVNRLLFVNSSDLGQVTSLVKAADDAPLPYERGTPSARFQQPDTKLMCQAPPWGRLTAYDVDRGTIAWQSVLGISDNLPPAVARTGRPNIGGSIVTAGGVVFIGATDDSRFRAFDAKSGKQLFEVKLEASAHATPITYSGSDGRQFVAITATGGSYLDSPVTGDSIVAFALPKDAK